MRIAVFVRVLSVIGLAVASYLYSGEVLHTTVTCGFSSCAAVTSSAVARIFDIPFSLLGVLYYSGMLVVSFLKRPRLLLIGSVIGVLFSAYFTSLEVFVLHAWCQWCVLSAWITVALLILSLRFRRLANEES